MLTELEIIELKYLQALGFKYIGRNENGVLAVFKEEPVRHHRRPDLYGTWVIGSYPIKDFSLYSNVKLGQYNFVAWKGGVVKIDDLINQVEDQLIDKGRQVEKERILESLTMWKDDIFHEFCGNDEIYAANKILKDAIELVKSD